MEEGHGARHQQKRASFSSSLYWCGKGVFAACMFRRRHKKVLFTEVTMTRSARGNFYAWDAVYTRCICVYLCIQIWPTLGIHGSGQPCHQARFHRERRWVHCHSHEQWSKFLCSKLIPHQRKKQQCCSHWRLITWVHRDCTEISWKHKTQK